MQLDVIQCYDINKGHFTVRRGWRNRHEEHSLCIGCEHRDKSLTPSRVCQIRTELDAFNKQHRVTSVIWECSAYQAESNKSSTSPVIEEPKEDHYLTQNVYGVFAIPRGSEDRPLPRTTAQGGVYEVETIKLLTEAATKGDVVHAGAFFGDFLPAVSRALINANLLWAFEPNPVSYIAARRNCRINTLSGVKLHWTALGNKNGNVLLHIEDNGRSMGGHTHILHQALPKVAADVVTVPVRKLDDLIPKNRHVALIQFDVEGYELQALQGAVEVIKRCLPCIVLETVPHGWIKGVLEPLGYSFSKEIHGNSVFIVPD